MVSARPQQCSGTTAHKKVQESCVFTRKFYVFGTCNTPGCGVSGNCIIASATFNGKCALCFFEHVDNSGWMCTSEGCVKLRETLKGDNPMRNLRMGEARTAAAAEATLADGGASSAGPQVDGAGSGSLNAIPPPQPPPQSCRNPVTLESLLARKEVREVELESQKLDLLQKLQAREIEVDSQHAHLIDLRKKYDIIVEQAAQQERQIQELSQQLQWWRWKAHTSWGKGAGR